jgi:hypothetical protein
MFIYDISLATAGNLTTNGTPGTETETFFVKPGANRTAGIRRFDVQGKAAAVSTLSGLIFRFMKWSTASTAGTGITPRPRDTGNPAASATAASRPTAGSTRVNGPIIGCSISGPNCWTTPDDDGVFRFAAGNAGSLSIADASGTASLTFEANAELIEV